MVEKASGLDSDVVLLDCEDSVPEDEKEKARKILSNCLVSYRWKAKEVGARVNGLATNHFKKDIEVAVASGFRLIAVPKVESAEEVRVLEKNIRKLSKNRNLPEVMVMIETAKGLVSVEQILASGRLVTAVEFGAEDFALSLGIRGPSRPETTTLYARSRIVAAAHAFGADPIDHVFTDLKDTEGLRTSAINAKNLGFVGKVVIHPSQIDVVNRAFSPSREELNWARRVMEAWNKSEKEGRGALRIDDKMVDIVHVKMAQQLLEDAEKFNSD